MHTVAVVAVAVAVVATARGQPNSNVAEHGHLASVRRAQLTLPGAYRPSWGRADLLVVRQQQSHRGACVVPFEGPGRYWDVVLGPLDVREVYRDAVECLDGQDTVGPSSLLCE